MVILAVYLACALTAVITDRTITRGCCSQRYGCQHRDWSTTVLMGLLGPVTLVLFVTLAACLLIGDRR